MAAISKSPEVVPTKNLKLRSYLMHWQKMALLSAVSTFCKKKKKKKALHCLTKGKNGWLATKLYYAPTQGGGGFGGPLTRLAT